MMKNMVKLLCLFILSLPFHLYAEETFEGFAHRVESWAEGLSGYVVSDNGVTIDIGKSNSVAAGMEFVCSRQGETLTHPVTGKSLGKKKIVTGKIAVSNIEDEYSVCKILENHGIKKGDKVEHIFPVPVNLSTNLLSDEESAKIKYELFKSNALVEDSASPYSVTCGRKNSGADTARCSLNFNGKVVFYDDIEVKGIKIITTESSHSQSYKIEGSAVSMALGNFEGKDNFMTAIASSSNIIIYQIEKNKLKEKSIISSISGSIVNIEAMDVNKNGKDEIFVSVLNRKQEPASYIFEYDGAAYQMIESKIPYLFRSFYTGGKKHIICQNYMEGGMIGMIYGVTFNQKLYHYDTPYNMSFGANIYGYGEIAKDEETIMFFNRHGLLNVAKQKHIKTYDEQEFGNTPSYIIYSEKLGTGVNVGQTAESGGFFVYDEKNVVVPVYQRIIQLEDGSFLLYTNSLVKNNMLGSYKKGTIGSYFFTTNIVVSWKEYVKGKAVSDIDILSDGSHIAYIVSNDKNGQDHAYLYIYK